MTEGLLVERRDSVLRLTLDRPDARNALTPDQRNAIIDELIAPDARAVLITGSGGSFCSGADLRGSKPADPAPGDVATVIKEGAQRLIASVLDCEVPVVAAVDGVAAGIGAHLAFACDLIVCSDQARFIEVFVRRALVPDGGGAYLLPRLFGLQKAKELILLGDDLSAGDAKAAGVVYEVVAASDLDERAWELATRLASGPTKTLSAAKKLLNSSLISGRDEAFEAEAWAQEENMKTADAQEGVRSFVERRKPDFTGT